MTTKPLRRPSYAAIQLSMALRKLVRHVKECSGNEPSWSLMQRTADEAKKLLDELEQLDS
jgi:hypothetical protein